MTFDFIYPNSRENGIRVKGDPMLILKFSDVLSAWGGYVLWEKNCYHNENISRVFSSEYFALSFKAEFWNFVSDKIDIDKKL